MWAIRIRWAAEFYFIAAEVSPLILPTKSQSRLTSATMVQEKSRWIVPTALSFLRGI
jgi:hypothetical protein